MLQTSQWLCATCQNICNEIRIFDRTTTENSMFVVRFVMESWNRTKDRKRWLTVEKFCLHCTFSAFYSVPVSFCLVCSLSVLRWDQPHVHNNCIFIICLVFSALFLFSFTLSWMQASHKTWWTFDKFFYHIRRKMHYTKKSTMHFYAIATKGKITKTLPKKNILTGNKS